jgi:hypothetical protein
MTNLLEDILKKELKELNRDLETYNNNPVMYKAKDELLKLHSIRRGLLMVYNDYVGKRTDDMIKWSQLSNEYLMRNK